jgi:hypothetical protein
MNDEELLVELEVLLRTMPPRASIRHSTDENLSWLGRAAAIINAWNMSHSVIAQQLLDEMRGPSGRSASESFTKFLVLLNQARADLRMKTVGPSNVAVLDTNVFDYFDEIRQKIELAQTDILFVDPYLDAEFVSRYLPHVKHGITIRLLAGKKIASLVSSAQMFNKQHDAAVQIRSTPNFHDRYLFIDKRECYQSGASFKDGAKKAPTTITQITDAFAAVFDTYQAMWNKAKVEL